MIMQAAFSRARFGVRKLVVLQNTEEVGVFLQLFRYPPLPTNDLLSLEIHGAMVPSSVTLT